MFTLKSFEQFIFTRFYLGPSVERVLTISSNGSAPLNKMAAMPIKIFLLKNKVSFEAESWYISSGIQDLQRGSSKSVHA